MEFDAESFSFSTYSDTSSIINDITVYSDGTGPTYFPAGTYTGTSTGTAATTPFTVASGDTLTITWSTGGTYTLGVRKSFRRDQHNLIDDAIIDLYAKQLAAKRPA